MNRCAEPGCNERCVTTSPLCYWHVKVRDRLVDGYCETATVDGRLRVVWTKVHKLKFRAAA